MANLNYPISYLPPCHYICQPATSLLHSYWEPAPHNLSLSYLINNMSNFSTDLDCLDLQGQFQLSHRKFNRACDQMSLLDQRIKDMQVRYQRAIKNKNNTARYTLRQRLAVMTGVKMMFYGYASAQADKMDALREKIEISFYTTPSDSEMDYDSDDSSLEIWNPFGVLAVSCLLTNPTAFLKAHHILQKDINPKHDSICLFQWISFTNVLCPPLFKQPIFC